MGRISGLSIGWVALISGFIGSIVTAFFNYIVQRRLLYRGHRLKEKNIAYLCLVRISKIITAEEVFLKFLEGRVGKDKLDILKLNYGKFDFVHAFCAFIAEAIKTIDPIKNVDIQKAITLAKIYHYDSYFDDYFNFKIEDDLLAQFPKDAIIDYSFFINYVLTLKTMPAPWKYWIQTGDSSALNAQTLYSQMVMFKNIFTYAKRLSQALIAKGGISKKEVATLMKKSSEEFNMQITTGVETMPKIEAALQFIKEGIEKAQVNKT
jgi:hypothetical protein